MDIRKVYHQLYREFGPQKWWPRTKAVALARGKPSWYDGDFEVCVGAILTQNTAWTNVEKAIANLLAEKLMSPQTITRCPSIKLARLIKPSGYFNQKTKKLKIFGAWLIKKYDGDLKKFFKQPLLSAREELLSLWGIGPETADSMLLYAGNKPIFVIDAYTKRLCHEYGVEFEAYEEYQKFFQRGLGESGHRIRLYNEFHALIVRWGKENPPQAYSKYGGSAFGGNPGRH